MLTASVVALAACGSDSVSQAPPSSAAVTIVAAETTVAAETIVPAETTVVVTVAAPAATTAVDGPVSIAVTVGTDDFSTTGDRTVTVKLGSDVSIQITDPAAANEYHLHGYDLEAQAAAGATATIAFTASKVGEFELESHETEAVLLKLVVTE